MNRVLICQKDLAQNRVRFEPRAILEVLTKVNFQPIRRNPFECCSWVVALVMSAIDLGVVCCVGWCRPCLLICLPCFGLESVAMGLSGVRNACGFRCNKRC